MKGFKRILALGAALALTMGLALPVTRAEDKGKGSAPQTEQAQKAVGTITGFGALTETEITMVERLSVGEILSRLPDTLGVYLDGSNQLSQIPVSWYCPGGYEDSNDFYFQFSPTWDEDRYPLMKGLDVEVDAPYVGVYLADLNTLPSAKPGDGAAKRAVAPGSADEIFAVLTEEVGMNSAAACGVLANMHAESALNPRSSCRDTNGKTSYGLCQWNGGRFTRLKNWCSENGEDYTTITGQLRFLAYELPTAYPDVYNELMSTEDTEDGAYDAAYYWCYYYEMPASRGKRSKERGNLARNTYWPTYGGTALSLNTVPQPVLTGVTTPEITTQPGEVFHVAGTIQCSTPLEQVSVWVYDDGGAVTGTTVQPGTRLFSLSATDKSVKFSKLASGDYTYRITATTGGAEYLLLEHRFSVAGKVPEQAKETASGQEASSKQEEASQAGKQSSSTQEQSAAPALTDPSRPGEEHPQGRAITVRGRVQADFELEKVSALVLREDGSKATGGTASAVGKSYDLNKLDNKVGFSKLTAGRYTYRISVQAAGQTWTLLEFPFTVTPKAPGGVKLSRGKKALTARWSGVAGAEGYEVQYSRSKGFSGADIVSVTGSSSRKLSGLAKKKKYYVRVRSYVLQENGERSYSGFSRSVSAKTK